MNAVDLLVVVLVVAFALAGLRQGFVVSVVSFAGFVVGGMVGLELMPLVLSRMEPGPTRSLVALGGVVLCAVGLQALAGWAAGVLRSRIGGNRLRRVDAVGGALVGGCAVLVAVWLLGGVLVGSGLGLPLSDQARDSKVLSVVDDVMPGSPDEVFSAFGNLLDTTGFPEVFSDLTKERLTPVQAPDSGVTATTAVRRAASSTVKVVGDAVSCNRRIEGSGFVYAPERVMTNAHVVAGVRRPFVYVGGGGRGLRATIVVLDPKLDVAVLEVPGLDLPSLPFQDTVARTGSDAAVVGYPGDGPLTLAPARVRGVTTAVGQDVYGQGRVVRSIYSVRGVVRPGNSGGPLVSVNGGVLGVVFAASREDADTGYALTAAQVAAAARQGATATDDVSVSTCAG